ncbi:MAG TPA: FecR domain-containing protein [Cyclobacteriaceae bacterium]|nr:FecR domain-containing protein [Cyclobacteriaceae bacterium]
MDYREYSVEDLALDGRFQKWILAPNDEVVVFWEQWIKENPQHQQKVNDAINLIRTAGLSGDAKLDETYLAIWKKLNDNILHSKETKRSTRFTYAKAAAVFIGLVVSSYFLWNQFGSGNKTVEYQTAYGEVKEFVLEDGSKVTLNSNSHLTTTGNWNDNNAREVFLEGEAFFEIVKTKEHKTFEVNTEEKVHVQVLGTEFNVSTRREHVEVYLQSGKVKISSLVGEATLKPGDFVVYQKGDQSLVVKQNALEGSPDLLDWKSNFYIFNDTPLSDIVQTLEDNYGFKIVIKDPTVSQKKITAKISRNDVSVLLKVLSETLNIKIEQDGNQLTFNAN